MGEEIELKKSEESKSRFSDDGMETEIEVQEDPEAKPRRKKKQKKQSNETRPKSTSSSGKESVPDTPPPEYQSQAEMSDDEGENKGKIKNMKKNFKAIRSTPLILLHALVVCVFLPIAIYSCDVILSVNVLQTQTLENAVINDRNEFGEIPLPIDVIGNKYEIQNTVLATVQSNARNAVQLEEKLASGGRSKRQSEVGVNEPFIEIDITTAPTVSSTFVQVTTTKAAAATVHPDAAATTVQPDAATTVVQDTTTNANLTIGGTNAVGVTDKNKETTAAATVVTEATEVHKTTTPVVPVKTKAPTEPPTTVDSNTTINNTIWKRQPGEYCDGIYHFFDVHMAQAHRDKTDWFDTQTETLRQKQQTLFFMYTVFGFIFLLATIALRSEMFLNEEWTSYIIFQSILYSISMSITVSVFAQENASEGLRCFVCRMYTNCSDIDPFDWSTHWPQIPDNDSWSLIALVSFVLKLVDCILVGCVTLGFIMSISDDPWYKSFLKVLGWIIFFPILIFTPMLGVIRYQAIPGVIPDDAVAKTAVEAFFYIGVALWAVTLTALPIFCKLKMCSKSREDIEEEIEDEYYN